MNSKKRSESRGRVFRQLIVSAGALTAIWLLAVTWASIGSLSQSSGPPARDLHVLAIPAPVASAPGEATPGTPAWGSEALDVVREHAFAMAPLSVANACGMGASSCFKCHNGTRAPAAKTDRKTSPWHPEHATVNDSCVGCHGGNPRVIKKDIAHTNMEKDPRASVEHCAKCHQAGNAPNLLKSYQTASTGGR